jgi:hypothetical protein
VQVTREQRTAILTVDCAQNITSSIDSVIKLHHSVYSLSCNAIQGTKNCMEEHLQLIITFSIEA